MSPSRLWPWPGLPRHPSAECVWMDTFSGCSLIDASVDGRGLMHSHSPLAFPANSACRLLPLSHGGCEFFFFFQKCQEIVLKRVHRVSSPCWPAKRNNYVRQGVRSEGKLSSWPDRRSQDWFSRQHTFLFFFLFFCLFLCWAPYYLSFNSICGWLPHLLLPNLKNSLHQKGSFKGSLYSTSTTGNVS